MLGSSVRIGRVFGIPIGLHYSWFLVFFGVSYLLAVNTFPDRYPDWPGARYWVVAFATSTLFFASILAHELGHSLMAMRYGIRVRSITLFVFGGVAQITRDAPRPLVEGMVAIAGPLVSLTLGGLFIGLYYLLRDTSGPAAALSLYLGQINVTVAIFNMIPGFPLDGGRVFRAIIWGIRGNVVTATQIAGFVGRGIGYLFVAGGLVWGFWSQDIVNGLWLAFVGWFLVNIAAQSAGQVTLREALRGVRVRDLMAGNPPMIPSRMDLRTLVENYVALTDRRCFLVSDGERWAGLVSVTDIRRIPRERWADTRVEDVMVPVSRVSTVQPSEEALRAMELMDEAEISQMPVVENGGVIGLLRKESIVQRLRVRSELAKNA